MNDVPMSVYRIAGRKFFYCQWTDPTTGKSVTRSTKKTTKREAERAAVDIQRKAMEGRAASKESTWDELREAYKAAQYPTQRPKTRAKTDSTFNAVAELMPVKSVSAITPVEILRFQAALRKRELSEYTVRGHLAELRKILRWGAEFGMVTKLPTLKMPKVSHAKGRAPTEEEFDRMIAKVESVVGKDAAPSWTHLLRGLWWSGLRLAEAASLRWTGDNLASFWLDLAGSRPMFHMAATLDKTGRDRIFPVAPEFAEFLETTPTRARRGCVFNPLPWGESDPSERPSVERIGKTIAKIGVAAKVKVGERKPRADEPEGMVAKYATAHDLRRSFGVRWSLRVLPAVLMELMRHEAIQTTMQFYVGRNAASAADQAWMSVASSKTEVHSPASAIH